MPDQRDKALRELEFRMAVTTAMLSTLDLDYVLYVILRGVTSVHGLGFNRAILFLEEQEGRVLKVKMAVSASAESRKQVADSSPDDISAETFLERFAETEAISDRASVELMEQLHGFSLSLHQLEKEAISSQALILQREAMLPQVLAHCLIHRSPFCSNSLALLYETEKTTPARLRFERVAIIPLCVNDRLIGAVLADNLENRKRVESDSLRSLHAMGNLAALAIDRARLHANVVAMAEVDGLTGVYNRRYYDQELTCALDQLSRTRQELSVIVFDVDHFKQYNDEYGHVMGDQVLKTVAKILAQNVRQADVVARYGGEEFVVLLKDTNEQAAYQVAEKLRQRVEQATISEGIIHGQDSRRITLSAGVTSTTGNESALAIFERADKALYHAKHLGRNRVVLAVK